MLSDVAGIVDKKGGFRVVVSERRHFKYHVSKGERLFVVPGLKVQEPVPFEEIRPIIAHVEEYITSRLAPRENACGGCQQCCITPAIKSDLFNKSPHAKCHNCSDKGGCRAYFYRPTPCREFECLWLKSQKTNHPMPPDLRPDRCGVFFVGDVLGEPGSVLEVHPSLDADVNRDPVRSFIEKEQAAGRKAYLVTGYEGETM